MNEQNLVNEALNRLHDHFGPRLLRYPPIAPDTLGRLEEIVGRLPSDLVAFLNVCNGLRVDVEGREDAHIWGSEEVIASAVDPGSSMVPRCLLPLRGDPTGGRDWIITECESARGAIMRWDPWTPTIQLLASSLGNYLLGWADYMKSCYGPDGRDLCTRTESVFSKRWIKDDRGLEKLSANSAVNDWLTKVAEAATCDDCECHLKTRFVACGPLVSS